MIKLENESSTKLPDIDQCLPRVHPDDAKTAKLIPQYLKAEQALKAREEGYTLPQDVREEKKQVGKNE